MVLDDGERTGAEVHVGNREVPLTAENLSASRGHTRDRRPRQPEHQVEVVDA